MSKWTSSKIDRYIEKLPEGYIDEVKEGMRDNADCHGCIYFIEQFHYCVIKKKTIKDLLDIGICPERLSE